MSDNEDYPELRKLHIVSGESQKIGEFLDWLKSRGMFIAKYEVMEDFRDPMPSAIGGTTEQLLAEYFKIDLAKVEREKSAILEKLRGAK